MTNEMQWGIALSMLCQVVSEESGLDRVGEISRVRSALNILRNLDVHDGGCWYEPDRDLCREPPDAVGANTLRVPVNTIRKRWRNR